MRVHPTTALVAGTAAVAGSGASAQTPPHAGRELPGIAAPASQPPARLVVDAPLPDALARGLAVIEYRAENLRIVPVFGAAAVSVVPRVGHVHVTVDDATWHWADASAEPLIIQGLTPGAHRVRIDLADPTHRVIDSATVSFEIPPRAGAH